MMPRPTQRAASLDLSCSRSLRGIKKDNMRKTICNGLLAGALSIFSLGGATAFSQQAPGAQPQRPSVPDTTAPGANPGMNNPDTMTLKKVDDKKFAKDAALGGLTEVELGKLAAQKGSRDDVKQFGQKMVDDHGKANEQLKETAGKSSIDVPAALDAKHQARIEKLSKLSGAEFDKAYIKDQLKDHQQDVAAFQSEAQGGTDPNLKQFAAATLPTLQEHLDMIKDINKKAKEGGK